MKKYEMKICSCGRIHMIKEEKIQNAEGKNKELLLICGGCGKATVMGADIEPDWFEPDQDVYSRYTRDFSHNKDAVITTSSFFQTEEQKGIEEILYSQGIKVPMMTGQYATDYYNGIFSDRWYPDFYKIQRKDVTVQEIMRFIDEYYHDRKTVNMSRFINETPEEILDELSNYWIEGFDWKGTKWEKTA